MVSRETLSPALEELLDKLLAVPAVKKLTLNTAGKTTAACSGFNTSMLALTILALWKNQDRGTVCFCADNTVAENFYQALFNIVNNSVYNFPEPVENDSQVPGFVHDWERYQADLIENLDDNFSGLVFTTEKAFDLPVISPGHDPGIRLKKGGSINSGELIDLLDSWGYDRVDHVYTPKTFAVRGGIVDIFVLSAALPARIEFFGDDIDSIRSFNPVSQRTVARLTLLELVPPPSFQSDDKTSVSNTLNNNMLALFIDEVDDGFSLGTGPTETAEHVYCQSTSFVRQTWEAKLEILNNASKQYSKDNIYIFADSTEQIESLANKIHFKPTFIPASLQSGFVFGDSPLACYTYAELFQVSSRQQRRWTVDPDKASHQPIGSLEMLDWGDLLVHQDFGIGLFRGLKLIEGKSTTQECISIEFADGGNVYVPIDKFSRVHKYIAAGESDPKLSSLGTSLWEKQKLKTRRSAAEVVKELVELYAQRSLPRGFRYQPDKELVAELEASFPYEETPDQALAIENSFRDFEKTTPMDRLVCGDVGFGTTEVALRAAMSIISSGYKVAFLAPTTVLADQHYLTSKTRLDPIGVRVELLSRFRSPKEQKQIIEDMSLGKIDLVVGTHRLLSKDINIPQLGLLVVDEEHRFGVKHKERIKQLKKNIDVMTLTATPIPRTLQQSLIGIRDISKIDTPPKERLPIRTSINYFDWDVITAALQRELNRNGQAFFLHNNIETLPFYQEEIQKAFPGKNVAVAHGQMSSRILESTMLDFFDNKIDILVCTTIIESGLDIANVNTIIINDAHRFGLAQTYQIRGRVGRSNRQAYCLLIIPKKHTLTKNAYQRLKAIEYFSNLGSGYDIALKDLEIRGAGNLFGFEQSGQISKVGFELYCKILKDAVDDALGNKSAQRQQPARIVFGGDAMIPADYMNIVQDRLFFYQRLADADSLEAVNSAAAELKDRFGRLPAAVENLIFVACLRISTVGSGLSAINVQSGAVSGTITDTTRFSNPVTMMEELKAVFNASSQPYRFSTDKHDQLNFELKARSQTDSMELAQQIVELFSPVARK